jgi:hypothetical protein
MKTRNRAVRWFVIPGSVAVLLTMALWVMGFFHLSSQWTWMLVIPADPDTLAGKAIFVSAELALVFVLYGMLGLILFLLWTWFQRRA